MPYIEYSDTLAGTAAETVAERRRRWAVLTADDVLYTPDDTFLTDDDPPTPAIARPDDSMPYIE